MAVAYRSFAHASASSGGNIVVTKPAGTINGDLMVALCLAGGGAGQPITAPAGWTLHGSTVAADARLYYRIASTEGASYTFTQGVLQLGNVLIVCYSGATGTPFDAVSGVIATTTGNIVIPTLTSGGSKFLGQIVTKHENTAFTPPGTATERFDATSSTLSFGSAGGDETVAAGATGSRTWDPVGTGNALVAGYMFTLNSAATNTNISTDLVGDGVVTRAVAVAESKALTGDGVLTRGAIAEGTIRNLTGDGVITRALAATKGLNVTGDGVVTESSATARAFNLTGDGVITEAHTSGLVRSFDLVGDGVVSRSMSVSVIQTLTGDGVPDATKAVIAAKTFDLTGDGVVTESHTSGLQRSFDLTGDGVLSGSADIPFPVIPSCDPDWTPNDGLKAIAGTVLFHEPPNEGDPVSGADVCLIRDSDGLRVECTTTAPDGSYSFPRDTNDPNTYHVEVTWTDGTTTQQGLSEGGCVPV